MTLSFDDLGTVSRAAVFGLARSGQATVLALAERGLDVVATDAKSDGALADLPRITGVTYVLGGHPDALLDEVDLVVVSPGIPLTLPIFDLARSRAIPVIGEIELASRLIHGRVIGITGTNGKSTTTALTAAILNASGIRAIACGNLGTPWIIYATKDHAVTRDTTPVWVVELSSFQLEGIRRFAPDVAVHLNLTPDHLDRYRSLDAYAAAKARIFENQRPDQWAVLNADDARTANIRPKAERSMFSRLFRVPHGAFLEDDRFMVKVDGLPARCVARRADLALAGNHHVENALASLVAASLLGATDDGIRQAFHTFEPLPHRTALVRQRAGVDWYDDSKGTNVDATLKSVEGFPDGRVWLILGGKDKGDDFSRLSGLVRTKARRVLTIGAAGPVIQVALAEEGLAALITPCLTLERAVATAAREAQPGDVVLLSPACASFDQFQNFEHRGDVFANLVRALPDAQAESAEDRAGSA